MSDKEKTAKVMGEIIFAISKCTVMYEKLSDTKEYNKLVKRHADRIAQAIADCEDV